MAHSDLKTGTFRFADYTRLSKSKENSLSAAVLAKVIW